MKSDIKTNIVCIDDSRRLGIGCPISVDIRDKIGAGKEE